MPGRVIVIGGGFAGLAAATSLTARGVPVTLLERRSHLGGRACSFTDKTTGDIVDNGQHIFMGCYRATLALLKRSGTRHLLQLQERLEIPFSEAEGRRYALRCPALPPPFNLALGLLAFRGMPPSERLAALRLGAWLRKFRNRLPNEWSGRSAAQWFAALGQGQRAVKTLWEPLVTTTINLPLEQASADLVIRALVEVFLSERGAERLAFSTVGLSELVGPAAEYIARSGGEARLGAWVDEIQVAGGRAVGVRLAGGEALGADAVISAVPHEAFARLVKDPDTRKRLGVESLLRLGHSPILGVHLWLDRPVMAEPFLGLIGTETQWVFNKTAIWGEGRGRVRPQALPASAPPPAVQILSTVISASSDLLGRTRRDIIARARRDLAQHLPQMNRARVLHAIVVHEKRATFAARPGTGDLRPSCETAVSNLFLAGDWTDTGLPATMEGAAQSGERAAEAAIALLRTGRTRMVEQDALAAGASP